MTVRPERFQWSEGEVSFRFPKDSKKRPPKPEKTPEEKLRDAADRKPGKRKDDDDEG